MTKTKTAENHNLEDFVELWNFLVDYSLHFEGAEHPSDEAFIEGEIMTRSTEELLKILDQLSRFSKLKTPAKTKRLFVNRATGWAFKTIEETLDFLSDPRGLLEKRLQAET